MDDAPPGPGGRPRRDEGRAPGFDPDADDEKGLPGKNDRRHQQPRLGRADGAAQRVGHPDQLLEPGQGHRRLQQHRRQRPAGPVLLEQRRRHLGPELPAAHHRRRLPLRSDRRLDLGRHRLVADDRHQPAGTTLKMRSYKSTNGGATWTFDNTFSGTQTNTDKEMLWIDHSATSAFKNTSTPAGTTATRPTSTAAPARRAPGARRSRSAAPSRPAPPSAARCRANANGDAFVFWPATGNSKIVMAKSTNGGTSWGTPR